MTYDTGDRVMTSEKQETNQDPVSFDSLTYAISAPSFSDCIE